ncbi:MAG TPA: hypothetical protein VEV41_01820 [Terriglobales bacterium]|nr:hypothetical protein [Terriglobales bacterium]
MRNLICHADFRFLALIAAIATPLLVPQEASGLPQFSRQYSTSCNTCHTAFPRLNDVGLAFKDAGFQFPEEDLSFIVTPRTLLTPPAAVPRSTKMSLHRPEYAAPPSSISDPNLRMLQQRYLKELTSVGVQINALPFPARFYLSPLGVDERPQKHLDQRSLRFATFNGQTVLEVTGNYCAVYLREGMDASKRARRTLEDVLLPILKVMVSPFPTHPTDLQGYVLEVSHRVRGRVLGIPWPTMENVALVLSREAAEKLVAAKDLREQQAALAAAHVYLNAEPITPRLADQAP